MKLLAFAALTALLAPKETSGSKRTVSVSTVCWSGPDPGGESAGSAMLLASGSSIEALTSSLEIDLAAERARPREPGIRARTDGGYRFTAHRAGSLKFSAPEESFALAAPVLVSATAEGWQIGDRKVAGRRLQAGVRSQDD